MAANTGQTTNPYRLFYWYFGRLAVGAYPTERDAIGEADRKSLDGDGVPVALTHAGHELRVYDDAMWRRHRHRVTGETD